MKIRWWVLSLLVFGLIVGPIIKNIPGFVIIALNETTVQFPLWLAVVLGLLFSLLVGIVFLLLKEFFQVAGKTKLWSESRKISKARVEIITGMLKFSEGDWELSERKMIKASETSDMKLINYLIAAQAAQKRLAFNKRDDYLKQAKKIAPKEIVAISVTKARLEIESKQYEDALKTLSELKEIAPKNKYVNKLLLEVNIVSKNWEQVLNSLVTVEKQRTFNPDELFEIQRSAICGVISGYLEKGQWIVLLDFWKKQSRKIRTDTELMIKFVSAMKAFGKDEDVEPILKKLLKKHPSSSLINLYATLQTKTPGKQLDFIESLPLELESVECYEALSTLSNKAELWGKSRDYLQKSLSIKDSVKTRMALSKVYVQLGEASLAVLEKELVIKLLENK